MKTGVLTTALAFAATFAFLSMASVSGAGPTLDGDGDGFQDSVDNCSAEANASQYDSDRDGIGNWCDEDANQDGLVGGPDFGLWKLALGSTPNDSNYNPDVEWNEPPNTTIGGPDFGQWKLSLGNPPGPSGRSCANPLIDVNDQFEASAGRALGTADPESVACPDVRRRGTFSRLP